MSNTREHAHQEVFAIKTTPNPIHTHSGTTVRFNVEIDDKNQWSFTQIPPLLPTFNSSPNQKHYEVLFSRSCSSVVLEFNLINSEGWVFLIEDISIGVPLIFANYFNYELMELQQQQQLVFGIELEQPLFLRNKQTPFYANCCIKLAAINKETGVSTTSPDPSMAIGIGTGGGGDHCQDD